MKAGSDLRFLFTGTLGRRDLARSLVITRNPCKLPDVLSVDEAAKLLEAAPGIKYKAALGVAYGAGLRVSEVAHLKIDDIDSTRMGIRSERRLCEEVHLNLAYRWFCRLGLDGAVPDHSTFSKNRHGRFRDSDLLRKLFEMTVSRCMAEGLVGDTGYGSADMLEDQRAIGTPFVG
ncbi:hypothetical protein FHR21_003157 [Sphingopyxis panaciterrulae]|uniref:Tyr recombinase domain-containing protein n=1 Tax=Sphingopyxis panaciterrulae TaxID=462372 RepID=A0A7W9ET34_9SPHN|nr:hypothetical protein [Sphingopyxis panaciterrulae]